MKHPFNPCPETTRRGFTLMELLVVITIVVALAALAFMFGTRALNSARKAAEIANLRQAGQAITMIASDLTYYPMGYNNNTGKSWASLVVDEISGDNTNITQSEILLSPVHRAQTPDPTLKVESITHFGCNNNIMPDANSNSNETPKPPKWKIYQSNLYRPNEQILLAGTVARPNDNYAKGVYKRSHSIMYDMRKYTGFGSATAPPTKSPDNAEKLIPFPENIHELTVGSLPDFNRYQDGKGRFFFADGHVQVMSPSEIKEKHWAVSY